MLQGGGQPRHGVWAGGVLAAAVGGSTKSMAVILGSLRLQSKHLPRSAPVDVVLRERQQATPEPNGHDFPVMELDVDLPGAVDRPVVTVMPDPPGEESPLRQAEPVAGEREPGQRPHQLFIAFSAAAASTSAWPPT